MERVAAGAHFPTLRLFEPGKRPDHRADNYLACSLFSLVRTPGTRFYIGVDCYITSPDTLHRLQPRPGTNLGSGPMSIVSELSHLPVPNNYIV